MQVRTAESTQGALIVMRAVLAAGVLLVLAAAKFDPYEFCLDCLRFLIGF